MKPYEEKKETESEMIEEIDNLLPIQLFSNPSEMSALLEFDNYSPRMMEDFDKIFEDEE